MTTTLKISFPDLPLAAKTVTASETFAEDHPVESALTGMRHNWAKLETATGTALTIDFDMGTGITDSCDHMILARADMLKQNGVTSVYLYSDTASDFSSAATVASNTDFGNAALTGCDDNDYIFTFSAATARRYWRVSLDGSSGTQVYPLSKIYIGTFFDIGRSPNAYSYQVIPANTGEFETPTGRIHVTRISEPKYIFNFEWLGVTAAKAQEFCEDLLKDPWRHYVFLYADGNDELLAGNELAHCRLVADNVEVIAANYPDAYTIRASFEQVLG